MVLKEKYEEEVKIPQGVSVVVDGTSVTVKGKEELKRDFRFPGIKCEVSGDKILIVSQKASQRDKKLVFTLRSHLRNMVKGVKDPHVYKLKICSGHFPMTVTVSGDVFTVKNFLGEKIPRVLKLKKGAKVTLEGTDVTVESADIELAGQVAAGIEQLCRITNRDIRIFQDGIYITSKPE